MSSVYSACFSFSSPNNLLLQDFREADDGVERGAQFVRHVGEKFRLVPVRGLNLTAFLLDLAETSARFGSPELISSRGSA